MNKMGKLSAIERQYWLWVTHPEYYLDEDGTFGYDLELYVEPGTGRAGREFVLKGHGGRIDLLCYDKKQSCFVVIELKNVQAGQNTFGQISSYLGWVQDHLRGKKSILPGKKPIGLVISRGYDTRFGAALRITDRIKHLNISDLGLG